MLSHSQYQRPGCNRATTLFVIGESAESHVQCFQQKQGISFPSGNPSPVDSPSMWLASAALAWGSRWGYLGRFSEGWPSAVNWASLLTKS